MVEETFQVRPIGVVRSSLTRREDAPPHASEGAPDALLRVRSEYVDALEGLTVGEQIVVVTWLHQADRRVLQVHPRRDRHRPLNGVFATRSPDRPNPIGLHQVTIFEMTGLTLRVGPLEAIDGTPIIDIKSAPRSPEGA